MNIRVEDYKFFKEHAGYCVGYCAQGAHELAKAEVFAELMGWNTEWVWDESPDLSWMSERELEQPHEVLGAILKDKDGEVLASLWGIVDPSRQYIRVIEAELALEAVSAHQWQDSEALFCEAA